MAEPSPAAPATPAPAAPPADPAAPAAAPAAAEPAAPAAPAAAEPAAAPAEPAKPAAGEEITYKEFAAPEGVELDGEILEEFTGLAKEAKLPQEAAQKFLDVGAKIQQKAEAKAAEIREGWVNDAKADSEIGGEQFEANVAKANEVFTKFGSEKLGEFLKSSGLGNHPELVRWAVKVAKVVGEDSLVSGRPPAGQDNRSIEQRAATKLYPNQPAA